MVRPQRPDYVGHDPGSLKEMRGPEGVKQYVATTHAAFANLRIHSRGPVAEGDGVATQYTFSGTHRGELMDIPLPETG